MSRQHLLIVEDDPHMAQLYLSALENKYAVHTASSGASAVSHVRRLENIDLVILDYRLPDMCGMEILKEIKKRRPSVPVIVVTAYGSEEVAATSFRCGAKEYIKKPFSFAELIGKIEFCLSLKSAEKGRRRNLSIEEPRSRADSPHSAVVSRDFLKIRKAVHYIDDNYMTKISLCAAAKKAFMSRHHFSRTFKKAMGVNFQEYLNVRRIEKAKEMLKNSRLPITEIAYSLGYGDSSHFSRIFKRMSGITPSQYKSASPLISDVKN